MNIELSILTCSLVERWFELGRLRGQLDAQMKPYAGACTMMGPGNTQRDARGEECRVEWIVLTDRGKIPIGEKRNLLMQQAEGRYIAFVDDDDEVDARYVSLILDAVQSGPDVVGIEGLLRLADNREARFCHSIEYAGWYESGGVFYRTPNHLNPVKRNLALRVGFEDGSSFGEDHDYSARIQRLLRTEVYIDRPIYFYNCQHQAAGRLGL